MLHDFTLADGKNTAYTLSHIVKESNLLLVFYRGIW